MKRRAITVRVRFEVFKRDNFSCRYCSRRPPDVELVLDHLVAVADGGTDDAENLITSCDPCNAGKSDVPVRASALPAISPEKVQELRESVERQRMYVELRRERERIIEDQRWEFVLAWTDAFCGSTTTDANGTTRVECGVPYPDANAVRNLLRDEIPIDDLLRAIGATRKSWMDRNLSDSRCVPYFFGCVKGIQQDRSG